MARLSMSSFQEPFFIGSFLGLMTLGYLKGKFLLQKRALKRVSFIQNFAGNFSLGLIFPKKTLLLLFLMMGLGMAIKYLPLRSDYIGLLDGAISLALFMGAYPFYKAILFSIKERKKT